MPTLEGLRRQIDTATDLSSVVTTMKTLAAVSIHQYERAVEALADYNRTVELGFQIALSSEPLRLESDDSSHQTAAVVFGSDQGMCGQFNEEIVSFLNTKAEQESARRSWNVLAVGIRAEGQLLDAGWEIEHTYDVPTSVSDIANLVQEMLPHIERLRSDRGVSRVLVFYNRRTSAASFEPRVLQVLPIDPQRMQQWRDEPWDSRSLPTFATPRRQLVSRLVRQYLFISLFRACAESLASENASRIAAMQAAEKNVEERLDDLRGSFNDLRQSAITEELLDVVTGFEALSKQRRKRSRRSGRQSQKEKQHG
ncbi:MAG: F0F1 ATP synthase subunit gamma [Planctomycetota bacterium]|nr:MAG: F0F1 ATP synthase subunit gamma [Planctomycetota bacterium]